MNLSALHEAVWKVMREGHVVEDSGPDDTLLSGAEQIAIRAWQRRLRSVGGMAAQLMPPNLPLMWLGPVHSVLAPSIVQNDA
jgi:hypothetical protein